VLKFPKITLVINTKVSQKKIIVADDDSAILSAMRMLLQIEGYRVGTTSNGDSINFIKTELPDLVLLDISMVGVSGLDICRKLKNESRTRNVPIIMISAGNDAEESSAKAGADDFIAKPFDINFLLKKIKQHISV
jgi:DNA-binding response OmpR family regulator